MRRLIWIATIGWWGAMFIVTHLPPAKLPTTHISDKLEHFVGYFVLTALIFASLWVMRIQPLRAASAALAIALAYGVIDELTQQIVGRSCSINDWYADAAGATAAATVALAITSLALPNLRR